MIDLCGCGKPVRYTTFSTAGAPFSSCNKYKRCPSHEELTAELAKANSMLLKYQKAINKIDDYFEYSMESKNDQKKVHQIIGNLSDSLT